MTFFNKSKFQRKKLREAYVKPSIETLERVIEMPDCADDFAAECRRKSQGYLFSYRGFSKRLKRRLVYRFLTPMIVSLASESFLIPLEFSLLLQRANGVFDLRIRNRGCNIVGIYELPSAFGDAVK